jgi:hypothetical protein
MNILKTYYNFFDTHLCFTTNCEECENNFQKVYGYFKSTPHSSDINCSIEKHNSSYNIKAISKRYNLEYILNGPLQTDVYLSLFSPVLYEAKEYFLIHAGSLSTPDGRSLFISAPSGFGKTTTTRELCKQGFKLLSDELAPLNLKTGMIYPYPRGMGVIKGPNKEIVEISKDIIGKTCPPAFVVFLSLEKDPISNEKRYMEIALGRIDETIIKSFEELPEVKDVSLVTGRLSPMIRLLLDEDAQMVAKIQEISQQHNTPIIYTLKGKTHPPDYNAEPKLAEISIKEGIFELSQNILNAHESALLEEVFRGSRPRMIFELAGLMNNVRFFTLTVGKLPEMITLIKNLCTTKNQK